MRTTYRTSEHRIRTARLAAVVLCVAALAVAGLAGCTPQKSANGSAGSPGSSESTGSGFGMGGVDQQIVIPKAVYNDHPALWDLRTPESAVRSYLAWVSYAYRIGESDVATPTQTAFQAVRTDAYTQMNLQKQRLLDQKLDSITFGAASKEGTKTLLPAKEKWTYRYVSIAEAGKTLEGPYTAAYETTYTLVKSKAGWQVDSITVTPLGEVK